METSPLESRRRRGVLLGFGPNTQRNRLPDLHLSTGKGGLAMGWRRTVRDWLLMDWPGQVLTASLVVSIARLRTPPRCMGPSRRSS